MTVLSKKHEELFDGVGCCSVPMYSGGVPDGFCDKPAYGGYIDGERYSTGSLRGKRIDNKYDGYVPALACPKHGGNLKNEPRVFMDGYDEHGEVVWCAVNSGFKNLQESPAEFHKHPWVAIEILAKNHPRKG